MEKVNFRKLNKRLKEIKTTADNNDLTKSKKTVVKSQTLAKMENYREDKMYFNKERMINDFKVAIFFIILSIASGVFAVLLYIATKHMWILITAYSLLLLFAVGLFVKQRYFSR